MRLVRVPNAPVTSPLKVVLMGGAVNVFFMGVVASMTPPLKRVRVIKARSGQRTREVGSGMGEVTP